MKRLGFYYNMQTCVGCGACQVACKGINQLNTEEFYRRVETIRVSCGGESKHFHYSGACNHCEQPACVDVCPVGAMFVAEEGTVRHDDGTCIGCGACMWRCPYGAISFRKQKGVTQKCEGCYERRENNQNPACVDACITHSLRFGELSEITDEEVNGKLVSDTPFLPSSKDTNPSVRIHISHSCLDDGLVEEKETEHEAE